MRVCFTKVLCWIFARLEVLLSFNKTWNPVQHFMSNPKIQKPTLGSGAIKPRKRNIQTKSDPEAFRNRIIELLEKAVSRGCLFVVFVFSRIGCIGVCWSVFRSSACSLHLTEK